MQVDINRRLSALVFAFAFEMQRRLDENNHKGATYRNLSARQLLNRLKEEVRELERVVTKKAGVHNSKRKQFAVDNEAADVANFACFIAEMFGSGGKEVSDD